MTEKEALSMPEVAPFAKRAVANNPQLLRTPDSEPVTVISQPWSDTAEYVDGAAQRLCCRCGCTVSAAPSTVALLEARPATRLICMRCALAEVRQ